ncbi:hypothetical protein L207DRAFT_529598 [Hyaloscypha variabilis F]|uniref:Hydrophobin n=1 Tax=Hyaloscypha variabilis (strain UAMH 11265 / GT02V1 / F) TaxID=1149755 RepID=A0A2J6RM94_HYAVF|nr:hypothetical protein L207DRAFT_529598 [Hyaloscypha variabilis F]
MQFLSIPNLALALTMTSAASAACSLPFDKSYCCNNLFPIGSGLLFLESYLNCTPLKSGSCDPVQFNVGTNPIVNAKPTTCCGTLNVGGLNVSICTEEKTQDSIL